MLLQFPLGKPLGTAARMMLCPNLSRSEGQGSLVQLANGVQLPLLDVKEIRNLENKQDLEMEMDRTQLHIIEQKGRTSPSWSRGHPSPGWGQMMTPNSLCAPQGKREASQMPPSSSFQPGPFPLLGLPSMP